MNPSYSQPASHTGVGTALALAQNYTKLKRVFQDAWNFMAKDLFKKCLGEYWAKNLIFFIFSPYQNSSYYETYVRWRDVI